MKVWTIVHVDPSNDGVTPWAHSFRTKHEAVQAVEWDARDSYDAMQDPNDPGLDFPGLDWSEDYSHATDKFDYDNEYLITETVLQ